MVFDRSFPHLEDTGDLAGGDRTDIQHGRQKPTPFGPGAPLGNSPASPPGENKRFVKASHGRPSLTRSTDPYPSRGAQNEMRPDGGIAEGDDEIENRAAEAGLPEEVEELPDIDFLQLVREAEQQSSRYLNQMNLNNWSQAYRAIHQQHYVGSKYTKPDWRNRSKFFRPKSRSAMRKDMAAVAASLFNNLDAINCLPGNEGDPQQRAAAAIMEELINYRTDRTSEKASIPWFLVAMGARQDALITGICISKQSWKLELRKSKDSSESLRYDAESDTHVPQDVYLPDVDRPDSQLIPPENIIIDPAAEWTNPLQSGQYVIIKWPMTLEEVHRKMDAPLNPWNEVDDSILRASTDVGTFNTAAVRRAREQDLDRFQEAQTGTTFQIIWVYETFMKVGGEDWTFLSITDQAFLTDPKPTRDVYPEQAGERPLVMGFGAIEAHRVYPMAPVTSWQQMQGELNDLVNLSLDAIKQNVMPVTKVQRGKNIDLDQVKRRSAGSSIIVADKDSVTWERPPDIPQSVPVMSRELELEFDDLAGQFNGQTAENSNALSRTLGGLKLVAGSANTVQEYDIRTWVETWVSPTLAQIVRLEQYYESDEMVLGLCGERAKLMQKHGVSEINDDLLEKQVTVRVNAGLGAGDPQQRLQKFGMAAQIAMPILQQAPEFLSGEMQINAEAIMEEIFGSAGYRDGGARFIKKGAPRQNPMQDLQAEELRSKIEKNRQSGKASMLGGLAQVAKVALGNRELEAEQADNLLDAHMRAHDMGHQHGSKLNEMHLSALDHGHRHGLALSQHQHDKQMAEREMLNQAAEAAAGGGADQGASPGPGAASSGGGAAPASSATATTPAAGAQPPPAAAAPEPQPVAPQQMPPPPQPKIMRLKFIRDPQSDRIVGAIPVYDDGHVGGGQVSLPPLSLTGVG